MHIVELEKGVSLSELASVKKEKVLDYVKRNIEDALI